MWNPDLNICESLKEIIWKEERKEGTKVVGEENINKVQKVISETSWLAEWIHAAVV